MMRTRPMMREAVVLALLWIAAAGKITPTQQVISMLTEIKAKGQKMMEEEQKVYATYAEWVDDEVKRLGFEILDGTRTIEELVSYIGTAESDVKKLNGEIAALNAEISKLSGEKEDATTLRNEQHAQYLKVSQDYAESVSALERAIQVLSSENYDRAQAEMLLQRMSTVVPGMPRVLSAFLQERSRTSLRGDGAPAVAAYEFQSGGIVSMLEGLHAKFKSELADVEEAESSSAHEFSLTELHLSNFIAKDTSDRDEKVVAKGTRAADSAKAKGELSETRAAKAADEQLSAEMQATFSTKTSTYKENQKVRGAELVAVAKAIDILSSPEVSGSYAKHINLAQLSHSPAVTAFLQLGRSRHHLSATQQVAGLLARHASSIGSKDLASLAQAIKDSPFEKVIGMITDLIERLKQAASVEADHKAWCDEQLKKNKLKRNKKNAQANKLIADIEGMEASIAEMGSSIQQLVAEKADLTKKMAEATELRKTEKDDNLATIADAKAGFEAVGKALVILKEFYSGQASLLQQVPEMSAYSGQQSGNDGVVGMLEVIQTDFSRLRADTEAAESAAATEYEKFMKASTASKNAKHKQEVQLRLDKDQTEYENGEAKKDLSSVEEELARANTYYDYLKPNCLEVHVNWDARVAQRKEEIAALKEAYAILDRKSAD